MPRVRAEETEEDRVLRAEVGARIRETRERTGLSIAKLAARLGGLDPNNMARAERGESWPSVPHLIALCAELDVSSDYLLFGRRHGQAKPVSRTRVPLAVAAFLATQGATLSQKTARALLETDYEALGLSEITPEEVRKFAAALAFE